MVGAWRQQAHVRSCSCSAHRQPSALPPLAFCSRASFAPSPLPPILSSVLHSAVSRHVEDRAIDEEHDHTQGVVTDRDGVLWILHQQVSAGRRRRGDASWRPCNDERSSSGYESDHGRPPACLSLSRACSILFQRGIYDSDSFTKVQKYGLGMQVTTDQGLAEYLKKVLTQLQGRRRRHSNEDDRAAMALVFRRSFSPLSHPGTLLCFRSRSLDWLEAGTVKKLVLVITGVENEEVLERSAHTRRTFGGRSIRPHNRSDNGAADSMHSLKRILATRLSSFALSHSLCRWVFDVQTDEKAVAQG
jgi:hypothetical protein